MSPSGSWPGLLGRRDECEKLSDLAAATRAGRGEVLLLRGGAGIGKTALLDFLAERAAGCRIARAAGVESEMDLAYAGLHQLCGPLLRRLERLPAAQRDALGTAFGRRPANAPRRSTVGFAVLALLREAAEERPLLCVVDDAQWLDRASAQTLGFVARRLAAERVAMVCATREAATDGALRGLRALVVNGLSPPDAATLLERAVPGPLDPRVRDRILAESRGNPLALLECPRGMPVAELAYGGAAGAASTPRLRRLREGFLRQVAPLPNASRRLLLVAAADPLGDVSLLWRAAERLGIGTDAATDAETTGLIEFGDGVRFRHPLLRSVVYRSAAPAQRREVHRALAEATDPDLDPDRRAWHRARAAIGPDAQVAADLEGSVGPARAGGGMAAAAAFLEQAVALTPHPARRVGRSLDAAEAKVHAGAFDDAWALLASAGMEPLREPEKARIDLLRGEISLAAHRGPEAVRLFLAAARRLEPLDPGLARRTYLDAMAAALIAGRLAPGAGARQVARAVRAAPSPRVPVRGGVLLEALAVLVTEGSAAAVPLAHRELRELVVDRLSMHEELRVGRLAAATAASLWDDVSWDVLTRRHLDAARAAGALGALPSALQARAVVCLFTGDLTAAGSLVGEIRSLAGVTGGGSGPAGYGEIGLLALRGRAEEAEPLIRACLGDAVTRGEGLAVAMAQWARATLCNGLGRYDSALGAAAAAAREGSGYALASGPSQWALAELVEAGARSGSSGPAAAALEELCGRAALSGTDWALGILASRRALLESGTAAEDLYREAIERLDRTLVRVDLARAQLLYGEWLRREGRRVDARAQLRAAHESFTAMGLDAFADRARRELLATGETLRKRSTDAFGQLTAQEAQITRLAVEGLTNTEIAAALYISPRTVEWHLRRIFTKLGVRTRRHLKASHAPCTDPAFR